MFKDILLKELTNCDLPVDEAKLKTTRLKLDLNLADRYMARHLTRLELAFKVLETHNKVTKTPLVVADFGTCTAYHPHLLNLYPNAEFIFGGPPKGKWYGTWYDLNLETTELPITSETVDIVLLWEVVEHFYEDPMFCFAEINRILKPNGVLFVTTPNINSFKSLASGLVGKSPYIYGKYMKVRNSRRHVHEHTPSTIKILLSSAGFDCEIWTENAYSYDFPKLHEFLKNTQLSLENRGDTIFSIAVKKRPVTDRYPASLYD